MAIRGVTFDLQRPTAKDHGALFAGILNDGIIKGCSMGTNGMNVQIGTGYLCVAGRLIQITSVQTVTVETGHAYARIKCVLDMSGAATEETFAQVSFVADYADTVTGFDPLTKQDVNSSGQTYEVEMAVYAVGAAAIDSMVRRCDEYPSPICRISSSDYGTVLPTAGTKGRVFFKVVS